jgi:hypothetical protein
LAGRVSLLTGLAPVCHGLTDDVDFEELDVPSLCSPEPLQAEEIPNLEEFSKSLKKVGYLTIFSGRACPLPKSYPSDRNIYDPFIAEVDDSGASETVLEQTQGFVKRLADETKGKIPFFACLSFDQLVAFSERRSIDEYNQVVSDIDRSVGIVLDQLAQLGVAERTLVVFCSTSGSNAPVVDFPYGNVACAEVVGPSAPLRGLVASRYEGGTRIPLLMSWAKPDAKSAIQTVCPITPGTRESRIVAIWDLFPTFARLVKSTIYTRIDGYDLVPLLEEARTTQAVNGAGKADDSKSLIRPQWIVQHFPHSHPHARFYSSLRIGKWKLIYSYFDHYSETSSDEWQLFNLSVDPSESTNLAIDPTPENKNILTILAGKLKEYLDGVHARYPIVTDPHSHRVNGRRHPIAIAEFPTLHFEESGE